MEAISPRAERWAEHFRWSAQAPCVLEGTTASGRATIERLQLNHPDMVATRRLLAAMGLFHGVGR